MALLPDPLSDVGGNEGNDKSSQPRRISRSIARAACVALLSALAVSAGCLGTDLGVQGGSSALEAKFAGIDSVQVISPTAVIVKWNPLSNYVSYNIYISTQDAPIGNSVFNSFQVTKLKPGTAYSFSVAGVRGDGSQDGISRQVTVSTWTPFIGATSAVATDSADVKVLWKYFSGPSFEVFYNVGSPPSAAQLSGAPSSISQSNSGATIGGLQPNTTYYFSVIAKYPDGTTNLDALNVNAAALSAQYTSPGALLPSSLPALTTSSQVLSTAYPVFNATSMPTTYQATFFTGTIGTNPTCATPIPSGQVLALLNGSSLTGGAGSVTAVQYLPLGPNNVNIRITDTLSGNCAYAVFSGIMSTANPATLIPSVSATTPTSLSPLPIVTGPSLQLGPFPTFTVSGAMPGYKTQIFYNNTVIGTITGNGNIQTLSSSPLPRGAVQVQPVVTYNGQIAYLNPITVRIKSVDPLPYTGPTDVNGGGFGGGMGSTMVVGDFNCDGFPDLAVAAPFAPFAQPTLVGGYTDYSDGAVAVYYGSPTGLIGFDYHTGSGSIKPVVAPTGKNPLLIPAPATPSNPAYYGKHFGYSLAAGNLNGVSVGGKACSDLVVGSPLDYDDTVNISTGAVYVYYGAPSGLQVTPYNYAGITCAQPGSYVCGTSKLSVVPGMPTRSFGGWSFGGIGWSVAVGDFNGDGYDDIAVGMPEWSDPDASAAARSYDGGVLLFWGTANGVSPQPQVIHMPVGTTTNSYSYMGLSVAFGYVSDSPTAPYSSSTPFRKKDLIIGVPNLNNGSGRGGVIWVQGTPNLIGNLDDPVKAHLVSGYVIIQPPQCATGNPKYYNDTTCGYQVASADVNLDGYDDILFSDPWAYSHYSYWPYSGAVFAYYGSSIGPYNYTTPPVANVTTCTTPNNVTNCNPQYFFRTDDYPYWEFGTSLTVLGDVNGDGIPDIGIGAPGASPAKNSNYTYNGLSYIYYGSSLGLVSSGSTAINLGSPQWGYGGMAMAAADFRSTTFGAGTSCTGKQCPDVVVGVPGEPMPSGGFAHGGVHLFQNAGNGFGGSLTSDNATGPQLPGKVAATWHQEARIVGDLNGDGYADIAAPVYYTGPMNTPTWQKTWESLRWGVAIYYGGANGPIMKDSNGHGPAYLPISPTAPQLITDMNPATTTSFNNMLGRLTLPAGDMNGDGFADLIIGWNNYVYFYYGSANGLITTPAPLASPASSLDPKILSAGTWVGMYSTPALGTHGDFNGDGYSDVAMTRHWASLADPIMIIYGSANGPVAGGAIMNVQYPGYPSSNSQNNAVRTPTCSGTYPSATCQPLEICTGNTGGICSTATNPNATNPAYWYQYGNNPSWTGIVTYLMAGGDLDKDGTDDLIAGAAYDDYGGGYGAQLYQGAVYIYYGSTNGGLDPNRFVKLRIPSEYTPDPYTNRYLGYYDGTGSISKAYDVNGDGIADFVVSSARETTGPNGTMYYFGGAAYIIYGINGGYKALGSSVCPGYPCTVTLSPAASNVPDYNPAHLVENVNNSCDPSSNNCNPMRFYPYNTNYYYWGFGSGAVGLGDITGDGFGEVAVGAYQYNGRVIIYSGSQSGLQVASQPSTQPSCINGICTPYLINPPTDPSYTGYPGYMGYNLNGYSEAGDVDKDGKRDFLITSYYFNDPAGNGFYLGGWFLFH